MKKKNVGNGARKGAVSQKVMEGTGCHKITGEFKIESKNGANAQSEQAITNKQEAGANEASASPVEPEVTKNDNLSMDHLVNESMIPYDRRELISAQLDNGDLILHIVDDLTGCREHVYICPDKAFEKVPEVKKLNRLVRDIPMKHYEESAFNLLGYSEKYRVSFQLDHMERYHRPDWYQEMDRYIKGETDRFFTKYRRLHGWAKNEAKPPF